MYRLERTDIPYDIPAAPRTEPNRTEPNRTEPNRTEPNRTEPNRTEPNRTEPNRTEPLHVAQFPRAVSPVRGRYDPVSPPGSARRLVPVRGAVR